MVFLKREWKYLDLECAAREERRQITRQQKGVRSSNEDVILLGCVEAVNCTLKAIAHLNLVDKQEVLLTGCPMLFYIGKQRVIFEQVLKLIEVVVDVDDIRIGKVGLHIITEGFEQFRLPAAADAGDDLMSGTPIRLVNVFIYDALLMSFTCGLLAAPHRYSSKTKIFQF